MKIINLALCICIFSTLHGVEVETEINDVENLTESTLVTFSYENEDLVNIINHLSALKNINVILPQGDALATKITLHFEKKITLAQAWDTLGTLLDIAGFCMVPAEDMVRIIKNSKEISREPMPTYIGVSPDQLPDNDQQIRYLYYLANIKVSDEPANELNGILKDLLPENALYKGDSATNGLLLIGKANDIRAAMKIIVELDQVNFQEKVDILSLYHTSASIVAQLINEQLIKSENANPYRLDTKKPKEIPYFSGFTKIIPEVRLNKLIILGRPQAVERLKDFIKQYIDVAPDTGKSILHIYQLQYLDAQQLAPVLNQIIQGAASGGPSQASAGDTTAGGIERFFDRVTITTDSPGNQNIDEANTGEKQKQRFTYYGGNNLVVAARNDDWKQIKKLIEELDIPQKQVLIEVLIADLTIEDARLLGAMTRTPDKIPLPDSIEFQSAMLGQPIPTELPTKNTTSIESNLLQNAYDVAKTDTPTLIAPEPAATNANLAGFAQSGTTMLSLNDNNGNTWSIWELLQLFTSSKILSHPHIVARNNKEATVTIGQTRWLLDKVKDISGNYYGGATTINFRPIAANLTVTITPRISSANTVNLQVLVDINEFQAAATTNDNTKTIRRLETNANIKSGGIFALGGLIRTTTTNSLDETPFLGRVPILGWFAKRKNNNTVKTNLTVFISPTIIEPRLREGVDQYTQDYINIAKDYSRGELFDELKDPVTRWFFKEDIDTVQILDTFTGKDEVILAENKGIPSRYHQKADSPVHIYDSAEMPISRKSGILMEEEWEEPNVEELKRALLEDSNPFEVQ